MPLPTLLSPSQLSYLHTSLSLNPPIRPDARTPTTFRSLRAETDFLPAANGSARVCFADGGEAIVGVRAEVEKTVGVSRKVYGGEEEGQILQGGNDDWVEVGIEMSGQTGRDEEGGIVFLGEMLREGLLDNGELRGKLVINRGWHWRLFIDILLLLPPQTYPLPLLSLTTHLALLATRLPALVSEEDDDPLFNDDWEASLPLYAGYSEKNSKNSRVTGSLGISRPPITLLIISVGENIFFDPTSEELAVADAVVAISVGISLFASSAPSDPQFDPDEDPRPGKLRLLALRTIDPPGRQLASATGEGETEDADGEGIWRSRRGGMKRGTVSKMVRMVLENGGVGEDIFKGLEEWV